MKLLGILRGRDHIHITFITVYCYNCFILFYFEEWWFSHSTMSNSLWPCGLKPARLLWIFQARILERVAISFSRGSSWPRGWTCVSCIGSKMFYCWVTWEDLILLLAVVHLLLCLIYYFFLTMKVMFYFFIKKDVSSSFEMCLLSHYKTYNME